MQIEETGHGIGCVEILKGIEKPQGHMSILYKNTSTSVVPLHLAVEHTVDDRPDGTCWTIRGRLFVPPAMVVHPKEYLPLKGDRIWLQIGLFQRHLAVVGDPPEIHSIGAEDFVQQPDFSHVEDLEILLN